ncbi:MAG TPA: SDR family oxidoreductase [Sphingomonas sp.]|nr:SDR family oxidoreductase [Sphingomonas sp.]
MDLELAGKKVIVSAATRGVARAIAQAFLDEGATVAICGRRARASDPNAADPAIHSNPLGGDGVEEAVAALSEHGKVRGWVVDCGDFDAVTRWVGEAADWMGGIDIVVASASALGGVPRSRHGWNISYNVDLMSSVAMWDAAYPFLKEAAPSAFVQIGTITAFENHTFVGSGFSYGAMEAAAINYVHQLALEFMGEGIRCNTVSPGPNYMKGGSWDYIQHALPDYYADNLARQPAGRFGKPEEVANAVLFLASPRASWITGVNLTVDGGFTRNVKY